MADHSSKDKIIPRDDLPREEVPERTEQVGPLDVPQEELGDDLQRLEDRMLARQSRQRSISIRAGSSIASLMVFSAVTASRPSIRR